MNEVSWAKKFFLPVGLSPDVEDFILQTYAKRLRIASILAIAFIVTSNIPDMLLSPALFWKLAIPKVIAGAIFVSALALLRQGGSIVYLTWIFYLLVVTGAVTIGIMIYLTGGCHSHWAMAAGLALLIALTVSLLPPRIMIVFYLICFSGYLVPAMITGFHNSMLQTYTHLYFYVGFGVLAGLVSTMQHNLILQTVDEISRFRRAADTLKTREEELFSRNLELQLQKDAAQDLHKAQSEFLDNISHELRTPLTSILGFSNLLESSGGALGKTELHMLSKIRSQGEALLRLIENLMDLSSISSSSMALNMRLVYLPLVIHQVVDSLQVEIAASGHQLSVDCERDLPRVMADHERLVQVFHHLLSNAIKFTAKGSGIISIGCMERGGRVVAYVRDNGVGIRQDKTELIFQMFRQLDGSSTRKHGGVGIGLPIVKRIVDLHGADLNLTSAPGKGTEFEIVFQKQTQDTPCA